MTFRHAYDLRAMISENLSRFQRRVTTAEELKHSAVAVGIAANKAGQCTLILTRRTSRLRNHAGQWAFPGGRLDSGEIDIDAARRELEEEINLSAPEQAILGRLDDFVTSTGYLITPLVLWLDDISAMKANPDEVASIHQIDFTELSRPDSPQFVAKGPDRPPIIRMLFGDTRIHAPTAAIMYQFREVALRGKSLRVAHLGQPDWVNAAGEKRR